MKPRMIFTLHLLTFLLIFSWLFPLTRPLWDALDKGAFLWMNGWVKTNHTAQVFWAGSNHNFMDWVHDVFMLSFFAYAIWKAPKGRKRKKFAEFLFTALLICFTILSFNRGIFKKGVEIRRDSPSVVIEETVVLSDHVPWIKNKSRSHNSYPGDHATTATLFVALIFLLMGPQMGLLALAYGIYFSLPRLVAGSHWVTDIIMGSIPITLIVISWTFGTPLARTCIRLLGGKDEITREV
jgi:Kdo2-lipid A phosphotransferase